MCCLSDSQRVSGNQQCLVGQMTGSVGCAAHDSMYSTRTIPLHTIILYTLEYTIGIAYTTIVM